MHSDPELKTELKIDSDPINTEVDDSPKFGRLLLVLVAAVMVVVGVTFASLAYYS